MTDNKTAQEMLNREINTCENMISVLHKKIDEIHQDIQTYQYRLENAEQSLKHLINETNKEDGTE